MVKQKQRQKQSQKVIVNINTEKKAKRKYVRKPKAPSGASQNNPPPPPYQPQMVIHQNTFGPQPLIQNPTILQPTPQQVSNFVSSVQETVRQVEIPKNNGIERAPPPQPRQPTPPSEEEEPVELSAAPPQNKAIDHDKMKFYKNPAFKHPKLAKSTENQEQHRIIDYHHEPTVLETRPIRTGVHTFQEMLQTQSQHEHGTKRPTSKETKGVKLGGDNPLSPEDMRQRRISIFDKPITENKITEHLHQLGRDNEADERNAMYLEERRIHPYIHDEQGFITPNKRFGLKDLHKKKLGTSLDAELSPSLSLDEPPEPPKTETAKTAPKKVAQLKYTQYDNLQIQLKKLDKKQLQAEMRRVELKPFFGKGEKTKAEMKEELLRLHHTKPELFSKYK